MKVYFTPLSAPCLQGLSKQEAKAKLKVLYPLHLSLFSSIFAFILGVTSGYFISQQIPRLDHPNIQLGFILISIITISVFINTVLIIPYIQRQYDKHAK